MYILDGYVDEKPLYTQDLRRKTPKDFIAEHVEWLSDEGLAILSMEDEAEEGTKPASLSSLFVAQPGESSSEGSSNIRKLAERIGAVGTVPGGGDVVAAGQRPLQRSLLRNQRGAGWCS